MELNDLIFLGACSLLSGYRPEDINSKLTMERAVKEAKLVWEETCRQDCN